MKVACTVLRGAECSDAFRLPDQAIGGKVRKGEHGTTAIIGTNT